MTRFDRETNRLVERRCPVHLNTRSGLVVMQRAVPTPTLCALVVPLGMALGVPLGMRFGRTKRLFGSSLVHTRAKGDKTSLPEPLWLGTGETLGTGSIRHV